MKTIPHLPFRWCRLLALAAIACVSLQAAAAESGAAALRARHEQLAPALAKSPFQRPLTIASSEAGEHLQGSIDAIVAQPYTRLREQLQQPAAWCEVLMLHINTKQCATAGPMVTVHIGRKHDQPVADAYRVDLAMQTSSADADYLEVRLTAEKGPFSTRDYRIQLQAIPIEGGAKSFLHLQYAYGYGLAAKLAMQGYLATVGADKIGFSDQDGHCCVGGVRGAVERNTMRYYLAIDAYLASLSAPPAQQRAQRLDAWFAATEQYAKQLHEMDRATYLAMKGSEYKRLAAAPG